MRRHTTRARPAGRWARPVVAALAVTIALAALTACEPHRPTSIVGGYGAWLDVFDWSPTITGGSPAASVATIDAMATAGVDTLYLQTARRTAGPGVLDEGRLRSLISRAHDHHIRVVGWYLPTLTDLDADLTRLTATLALPLDGIAVDIESDAVADVGVRNARLVALSKAVHARRRGLPMIAITPPPVGMEQFATDYWPGFPWKAIKPYYGAWMPMAYWSYRTPESGWRDGYRYTKENVLRVRARLGDATAKVHPIGSPTSMRDMDGLVRAVWETGALGGSLYDWQTTDRTLRTRLRPLHDRAA